MVKVRAPGKLVITGAYAVLEGAPAVVVAVDRHAEADPSREAEIPSREVTMALAEGDRAPACDASRFVEGDRKLGLGSSAAVLVASLGALLAKAGHDVREGPARQTLFRRAFDAHRAAQAGGSGVDVAASVYGGALRYSLVSGRPSLIAMAWPEDVVLRAYFSGESARTSELLARVAEAKSQSADRFAEAMAALARASEDAAEALGHARPAEFVLAAQAFSEALDAFDDATDAGITPLAFRRLGNAAQGEAAAFYPSGAGGGDCGIFVGLEPPSEQFEARARELGMTPLDLRVEDEGVRPTDHEGDEAPAETDG